MEKVVVDGSSIACEEKTAEGKPKLSNLKAMRETLQMRGFDPVIIVDANLRHEIDNPQGLEELLDKEILQAPANTDADFFVLKTAEPEGAKIVSNDLYSDYREQFPWIHERRVPFMIVNGLIELYPKLSTGAAESKP